MVLDDRQEAFLTVAEVAELLKLNQQTVRNWIDQGTMPAVRIGRRVRIRRSDLDRLLDSGYQGPSSSSIPAGPSAEDFWSGEPVGAAELAPAAAHQDAGAPAAGERDGAGSDPRSSPNGATNWRSGSGVALSPSAGDGAG
jgi:excisionase family DNA binding protein